MAKSARKAPSTQTLRQLYVLSGNLCAKPGCNTVLVNANGTLVGEACHIKAECPGGARFDKNLSDDQRRAFENLIFLCNVCHKLVDTEPKKFTVVVLTKWKRDREERFAAVGDTLRQRYLEISDEPDAGGVTFPKSLQAYIKFLVEGSYVHTIDARTVPDVVSYVERLRHVSLPDRNLMRAIVEKCLQLGGRRTTDSGVVCVHPDDLKTIMINDARLSDYRIRKLSMTLDRNGLGFLDADEEPELTISAPDEDLDWSSLAEFLKGRGKDLRHLLCDMKFGLLD